MNDAKDWWLYLASWLAAFVLAGLIVWAERWWDARRERRRMAAEKPAEPMVYEGIPSYNARHFIVEKVPDPIDVLNLAALPAIGDLRADYGTLQRCCERRADQTADDAWDVTCVYRNVLDAEIGTGGTVHGDSLESEGIAWFVAVKDYKTFTFWLV